MSEGSDDCRPLDMIFNRFIALAFLAVATRVIYVLAFGLHQRVEVFEYEYIAISILEGNGFGYPVNGAWFRTFGSPPFSYVCALLYLLFGHSHFVVLLAQAVFSGFTALACYAIARRLFSAAAASTGAVLAAFHPGLFFYDTHKLHSLSFDALLAVGGVWIMLEVGARTSRPIAASAGLVHGLGFLERSTLMGLVPLVMAGLYSRKSSESMRSALPVYLIALTIAVAPWVIRNFIVLGQPVLVTTTAAEVFWRGNNPAASGGSFAEGRPDLTVFEAAPEALRRNVFGKDEITQSRIFYEEAKAFIVEQPLAALRLYGRKFLIFWWFSPYSGALYPAAYLPAYKVYYALVLPLALIGFCASFLSADRARRRASLAVVLFMGSVALLQSAFYVEIRHRWGIEPLILIFTAGGGGFLVHAFQAVRLKENSASGFISLFRER